LITTTSNKIRYTIHGPLAIKLCSWSMEYGTVWGLHFREIDSLDLRFDWLFDVLSKVDVGKYKI